MSVETLWRSVFSSSVTQLTLLPVIYSLSGAHFCMAIMSQLVTVAIVMVSA